MWEMIQAVVAGEAIFEAASILLNVAALAVWYVVGCAILSAKDHEDRRLFRWAKSGPLGTFGFFCVVMAWPVTLMLYRGGVFDEP